MARQRFRAATRGRGNFGVMLLLMQMLQIGFENILPVTLVVIAINVGVYLGVIHEVLDIYFPRPHDVCVGIQQVWIQKEWRRLLEATFHHGDDMHLYYNMVSFLMKSLTLERTMGSAKLATILATFSVLINVVMLYLNFAAGWYFQDTSYLSTCAVGFSGVVFAIKVITTDMLPHGRVRIMGFIPVPSKYSCWAELILIHILVPNASFTGHLAGILVGYAYTKGPLRYVLNLLTPSLSGRRYGHPSYTYHAGTTSNRPTSNVDSAEDDEQLNQAIQNSLNDQYERSQSSTEPPTQASAPTDTGEPQPPPYGWNIPPASNDPADGSEMRRRWLNYSS